MTSLLARRSQILTGIILAFSVYICIIQHVYLKLYVPANISPSSFPTTNASSSPSSPSRTRAKSLTTTNNTTTSISTSIRTAKKYSCAIYWLRLPKTASTAIMHAFMGPLLKAELFSYIQIGPNNCIQNVGGCAPFWDGWTDPHVPKPKSEPNSMMKEELSSAGNNNNSSEHGDNLKIHWAVPPPYGLASNNETQQQQILISSNGHQRRCFPKPDDPEKIRCNEFDVLTSTLNVGPHPPAGKAKKKKDKQQQKQHTEALLSTKSSIGQYVLGPTIKTHVGLDPSLFGWVFPHRTMIFSSFRNPMDRLLSSFHYGFTFGGGRPGEVRKCKLLPESDETTSKALVSWQHKVVEARKIATLKNDTRVYQEMLRGYLKNCRHVVDNAYVQFLDPNSFDVDVALYNLERYVIVGLQEDMNGTLDRWRDVALGGCVDHPKFPKMKKMLSQRKASFEKVSVFRESVREVGVGDERSGSNDGNVTVELISPDVEQFDRDLQQLVRELTAGDEVIYQRVVEMFYGSQKH